MSSIISIILLAGLLFPDVLPPQFEGYPLMTIDNDKIALKNEKVDIYWYDTCKIVANFNLENPSPRSVKLTVGFPIQDPDTMNLEFDRRFRGKDKKPYEIYRFKVKSNNRTITDLKKGKISGASSGRHVGFNNQWYGWNDEFKPGINKVTVEYNIAPGSSGRGLPWETIYYLLSTSAAWKGNIDSTEITVHFKYKIYPEQIQFTNPAKYVIGDKTVSWKFHDFEPAHGDNIILEIIPFDKYRSIQKYDSLLAINNISDSIKIEAARFFYSLGFHKGIGAYGTGQIDKEFISRINDKKDKDFILSIFKKCKPESKNMLCRLSGDRVVLKEALLKEDENRRIEKKLQRILSNGGYLPEKSRGKYVEKAKDILDTLLLKSPKNAKAWRVYLYNYYRMFYSGFSPFFGWELQKPQADCIKKAYKYCPDDPEIKLWHNMVDGNSWEIPDTLGRYEEHLGCIVFQVNPYGYGGPSLNKEELKYLFKYYRKHYFNELLTLKEIKIPENERKNIIKLLDTIGYYQDYHSLKLREYYQPEIYKKKPEFKDSYTKTGIKDGLEYGKVTLTDTNGIKRSEYYVKKDKDGNYLIMK